MLRRPTYVMFNWHIGIHSPCLRKIDIVICFEISELPPRDHRKYLFLYHWYSSSLQGNAAVEVKAGGDYGITGSVNVTGLRCSCFFQVDSSLASYCGFNNTAIFFYNAVRCAVDSRTQDLLSVVAKTNQCSITLACDHSNFVLLRTSCEYIKLLLPLFI